MRFPALLATALLASAATAQVTIPAHNNAYTGYSRGFNFTASTPFFIVQLDLPIDAFQVGDTAGYLVRVNGTTALWSIGNAGPIATAIPITPGDVVDVIGNWSPAAAGNFTAHNSYGSATAGLGAAPFATLIEGVAHTLGRTGWQWDIGAAGFVSTGATGTYLAPVAGQIGRVLMTTSAGGGGGTLATNTVQGAGCGHVYGSFYEGFANTAAFDLGGSTVTWINTGSGYTVLNSIPGTFVPPTGAAQNVAAGLLDGQQAFALSAPMPVFGGTTSGLNVCTKGYIATAIGNGIDFTPTPAELLTFAQTTWACWHDYDQTSVGSGLITFEEVGGIAYVTWSAVHSYMTASANSMQFQFDVATGNVTLVIGVFGGASLDPAVVGFSPAGASPNPGPLNISALTAIVLASPESPGLTLAATSRPITGTNWNLNVTGVPPTGVIGVDVFGLADPAINDLFFLGAPGCGLRASLDVLNAWFVAGNSHAYGLALPNAPALLNVHVYTTSAVFSTPPVNAFGAITANGIDGKIGNM